MNNNAELYQENNILQKRDARQCLEDYAKEIKWKNDGATVIDIGCGDGGVTTSILKPCIPNNFKKLVGCDIIETMIQHANVHHATNCIKFTMLDIESDLPDQFREKFDHAFSFYALQWIRNQHIGFSNIYEILVRGGDCLLMLVGYMPVYEMYRKLGRIPRWKSWMGDVERFLSPYHDSQDPEKTVERMMTDIGFTNVKVRCLDKEFTYYGEEAFKKAMLAVIPYKIPFEMLDDFWKDFVKVVIDMKLVDYDNNDVEDQFNVKLNYKTIIAYGQK